VPGRQAGRLPTGSAGHRLKGDDAMVVDDWEAEAFTAAERTESAHAGRL
jgi:hypothetical protein